MSSAYGFSAYVETAREIGARDGALFPLVLMRMLAAKAIYGLSAVEYAQYALQEKPFSALRDYQTKRQTTELFDRLNPHAERPQVEDKLRFHRICAAAGLPVPVLHAVLSRRGTRDVTDYPLLSSFDDVVERFRDRNEVRLILKPQNDALGTGVRFVRVCKGQVFDIGGEPIAHDDFTRQLYADMQRDDYLVQEFVRPHPEMAALGSGKALGTLRIVTQLANGEPRPLYALCRIPCGNNPHDNFSGGRTGNLVAFVDIDSGRLHSAFGRRDKRYPHLLEHFDNNPDTGKPIAGQWVPQWSEIRAVVERGARTFPGLPALGWDVALSDSGVVIIEANSNPDIIGAQVSSGQGARKVLEPLYA